MIDADFASLREARALEPTRLVAALAARRRRPLLGPDGRLFIVAADHPGRGAFAVGDNAMAMADRYDLLTRLRTALAHPGVDGLLGTADLIEDLAYLGALEGKLVVASVNRGGLAASAFELDDRATAYDIDSITEYGLDFAKVLLRLDLDDPASVRTLVATGMTVSQASRLRVPLMIEPFISARRDGGVHNLLTPEAVTLAATIASGLGASSAYSWLKLPVVEGMEQVMRSTTLPTLLLGGDPGEQPDDVHTLWARALEIPGVRGLVVGRSALYPPDGDVEASIARIAGLVHR